MRVAVIGCGSIGTRHARNLKALCHQVIAHDVDVAREFQVVSEITGTLTAHWPENLVGVDAALICTPAATHARVADELLQNGYQGPLFVEKPVALSVDECAIFRRWPAPVTVGYNWRWNRDVRRFFDDLRGRAVRWIRLVCATRIAEWPGKSYANPLFECSHELDLARAWDPTLRLVFAARRGSSGYIIDLESATQRVEINLDWDAETPWRELAACLDDGQILKCVPSQASIDHSYIAELKAFLASVESGIPMGCTAEDGIAVLDLVERAKRVAA